MSDEGTSSCIITAYYPDSKKWNDDFKTRRIHNEMFVMQGGFNGKR